MKIIYCNIFNFIDLINNLLIKSEENIWDVKNEMDKNFKLDNKVRRKTILSKNFFKKNISPNDVESIGKYIFSLMNILIIDFYVESNKNGKSNKFIEFEKKFFKEKEYLTTMFLLLNNILENIKFFLILLNHIDLYLTNPNLFAKKIKNMNTNDTKNFGNNWQKSFNIDIDLFFCNQDYLENKKIKEKNMIKDAKKLQNMFLKTMMMIPYF